MARSRARSRAPEQVAHLETRAEQEQADRRVRQQLAAQQAKLTSLLTNVRRGAWPDPQFERCGGV